MSSKLHKGGNVQTEPFVWRQRESVIAAVGSAQASGEAEAALHTAYQKGVSAGEAAAEQRASARLSPVLQSLGAIIEDVARVKLKFRKEAEEPMLRLALAVARRVLHREIATDPDAILGIIRSGLERLNTRERFQLRLSPSDAALMREYRGQLQLPESVEIIVDPTLGPGSAVFETARGDLDVSVVTQLDEIERGLTDTLRRRA